MPGILRRQWKTLAALVVVSAVAATACLAIGNNPQRTVFIGKTDARSGYRYRFTVSSGWRVTEESSLLHADLEDAPLSARIQQWVTSNLLHRSPSRPLAISLSTYTPKDLPGEITTHDGDTEPLLEANQCVVARRKFQVDGCPASAFVLEQTGVASPYDEIRLDVYVPNATLWYDIDVWTDGSDPDRVTLQMQAIIASFHVEKVVPADGRR